MAGQPIGNNDCCVGNDREDDGTVCHILPCAIDEDLTAPVAQYFRPAPLRMPEPTAAASSSSSSTTMVEMAQGDDDDETMAGRVEKKNDDNDRNNNNNNNNNNSDGSYAVMAAQFRGRGLLCAVDPPSSSAATDAARTTQRTPLSALPPTIMGAVLSQQSTSNNNNNISKKSAIRSDIEETAMTTRSAIARSVKVVETFRHVYNWRHEHDVRKVEGEMRRTEGQYGLDAALGWCDLAREVHDPIPVPP